MGASALLARHIDGMERRISAQQRYEQYRQQQAAPVLSAYEAYAC